jgi:C4-dicarboxylate transporter, DctM subunit
MEALLISLIILIVLIMIGVPVAMAFGAMTIFLSIWFDMDSGLLIPTAFYQIKSVVLLTIPFFIMVGGLMSTGGMAVRLIDFVNSFVGRIRGGLGAVTVLACAMFGSIGGACSAAVAAIGTVMIPRMEEQGYTKGHATALVACGSILGQLIPPSVPMIIFALMTYQSIPGCWLATVGPAMLVIVMYVILNYFMVRKMPLKLLAETDFSGKIREIGFSTYRAGWALLLPVIMLGGIYGGIATPTETACVAVLYVIPVCMLAFRSLTFSGVVNTFISSATTTGVLVIMVFFVMIMTRILTMEQIPQEMAAWLFEISSNKYVILLMVNIFLLLIGMLMDDISGTILAASLLFPIMMELGVHPLHFAAICGVNLGMGNVTPPTAPILYLSGRIGDCRVEHYLKPALVLTWCGMLPVLIVTTYWPDLSLYLPRLFGFVK